ncbi:hypothetical protein V1512DRAFT_257027 [Lipomyces arxii]|uniref:uncharacterized protein n=1 Tax=Lipomyces arxii TaxID=56418 RepID=UPI0034CDB251
MVNEKTPLVKQTSASDTSYSSIEKGQKKKLFGKLSQDEQYMTFLRIEGEQESDLIPLHEVTKWDLHFSYPLYQSMICLNDPCDGRDHGANERNYLAWLRMAAGFISTSFAFIISFYIPPGQSIFGPGKAVVEPSLQNRGALAWGLIFLIGGLGSIIYAYLCYVDHMHFVGRRALLVQFSWHSYLFFCLTILSMFVAAFYMMAGGLIEQRKMAMWM